MFAFSTSVVGKKWVGGNSDASSVARRRRNLALQKETTINNKLSGTTNPNNATVGGINKSLKGLTPTHDNTISTAISRVRRGGYIVPPKKSQKYLSNVGPDPGSYEEHIPIPIILYTYGENKIVWRALAMSSSGQNIIVGGNTRDGLQNVVYISNNWGSSFYSYEIPFKVTSFACNNTATVIIGCDSTVTDKNIARTFISTDGGKNWMKKSVGGSTVCCDGNRGSYMISAGKLDGIYSSSDYGNNWQKVSTQAIYNWISSASSDDGKYAVVVSSEGYVVQTDNAGSSWVNNISAQFTNWVSICCDKTCNSFAIVDNRGSLFVFSNRGNSYKKITVVPVPDNLFTRLSCDSNMEKILISNNVDIYMATGPNYNIIKYNPSNIAKLTTVDHSIFSNSVICKSGNSISAALSSGSILTYLVNK